MQVLKLTQIFLGYHSFIKTHYLLENLKLKWQFWHINVIFCNRFTYTWPKRVIQLSNGSGPWSYAFFRSTKHILYCIDQTTKFPWFQQNPCTGKELVYCFMSRTHLLDFFTIFMRKGTKKLSDSVGVMNLTHSQKQICSVIKMCW